MMVLGDMGSKSELNDYVTATSSLCFLRLLPEGSEFKSNSLYFPSDYCQNHTKLYLYFRLLNYYFSMLKAYSTLGFFFGVSWNNCLISGRFILGHVW